MTSLLVDATSIFYIQNSTTGVFEAPLAGGNGVSIAAATGYKLLAQDATYLYLVKSGCCTSVIQKILK